MDDSKKICVIGAGLAGLTSVKCLVDEGFNVKCFEKDSHVGGRWNSNNDIPIPRSTITNVPNFMSGYSDFPMPEKYPLFMSADQFSEYFDLYANGFDLRKHISFNTEVISVERSNVDIQSKWAVAYRGGDGTLCNEEFDFVVVSSGFYRMPYIPGTFKRILEDFTGRVIHSVEYVNWKPFDNQRVVVCGLGNTGGKSFIQYLKCLANEC